jgi:uncharacterized repeat protein (TIGR03803 family)
MKIMQRSYKVWLMPRATVRVVLVIATTTAMVLAPAPVMHAQTFSLLHQFKAGPLGDSPWAGPVLDSMGNLYGTAFSDGAHFGGTVYKLSTTGKLTALYNFTGLKGDGQEPYYGALLRDSKGNFYGSTIAGGVHDQFCTLGCGTVYKVDPNGKETVLHAFTNTGEDGNNPNAGLVQDSSGNVYGTTVSGGTSQSGIVFKVDPRGKETVFYSFTGGNDGGIPQAGLVVDSEGNLYGTTGTGGVGFSGTVFKLDPSGVETVLYAFTGATDGGSPAAGVILDSAGNLYGTTQYGGTYGFGTVFEVSPDGTETVLYSFTGGADGSSPQFANLVRDEAGNLYGTTPEGGARHIGVVFKVDAKGVQTVLHTFNHFDGSWPGGTLALDSKGNLYGTTYYGGAYGGGVVFKIAP